MLKRLRDDIDSMRARDPAARSRLEVILSYPGFHAQVFYRIANWFWRRRLYTLGRWISQWGRFLTGIEIHPGAIIGKRLFIDHGMGVVIGETAEIGDDVTLYHGVTLGGTAPSINSDKQRQRKRHPTLSDNVIVGAGAQVLGPITVGHCSRIGANSVVLADVPPEVTVTGIPARVAGTAGKAGAEFIAYGTPDDIPDPLLRALEEMTERVDRLSQRVIELESHTDHQPKMNGPVREEETSAEKVTVLQTPFTDSAEKTR